MEPPGDAEEQLDGSRIQSLPDGSSLRYTQRSDGSWRKPERIRAIRRTGSVRSARGGDDKRMTIAADPSAAGSPDRANTPKVYEELKDVLVGLSTPEERDFLFKTEGELIGFIESQAQRFVFPPMNGHFRRLLHITCGRFGVDSSSSSQALWGLDKGMKISKRAWSRVPVLRYADLIPATCSSDHYVYSFPADAPPVNIAPAAALAAAEAATSRRLRLTSRSNASRPEQHEQKRKLSGVSADIADPTVGRRRGRGDFRFEGLAATEATTAVKQGALALDTDERTVATAALQSLAATTGSAPESATKVVHEATIPVVATSAAGLHSQLTTAVGSAAAGHSGTYGTAAVGTSASLLLQSQPQSRSKDLLKPQSQQAAVADIGATVVQCGKQVVASDTFDDDGGCSATDAEQSDHGKVECSVRNEQEEELRPSQPTQYNRYTAEVRQASAQQQQARGGENRRTHASVGPLGADAAAATASHSTWRLRRAGNGFVTFKAKGTEGMSIIFSVNMLCDTTQMRGRANVATCMRQEQLLKDSECYYEVRLGQCGARIDNCSDASGYIAKHSLAGGMEILSSPGSSSVRLVCSAFCKPIPQLA